MFKIYNPGGHIVDELFGCYTKHFLPFDIEFKNWQKVSDIKEADFIPINGSTFMKEYEHDLKIPLIKDLNLHQDQKLLILNIFHLDNMFQDAYHYKKLRERLEEEIPNQFVVVHTNFACNSEIQYDFLWNRQKAYFCEYNRYDLKDRLYTLGTDIKNFEVESIANFKMIYGPDNRVRKFLCPNRVYLEFEHPRLEYRKALGRFISDYKDDGYVSDPGRGYVFKTDNPKNDEYLKTGQGGWYPISNNYYRSTYLSIYCETAFGLINGVPYMSVTEKTWDPLIKGHFIIPFGYQGLIQHLKSYGFKFPDWIDYSYDAVPNNDERFKGFLQTVGETLKYSVDELHELYLRDRHILLHNREIFWEKPHDSLYTKVKHFFNL